MYIIYTHTHTNTLNKGEKKVLFYDRMPANKQRRNKS